MDFKQDPLYPTGEEVYIISCYTSAELTLPTQNQRKRAREDELLEIYIPTARLRKRRQSVREDSGRVLHQGAASLISTSQRSHIMHWIEEKVWPKELFQADNITHACERKNPLPQAIRHQL